MSPGASPLPADPALAGPHPTRRFLPSIGAVLAGFLATAVLSIGTDAALHAAGAFPAIGQIMSDPLFVLAAAYRAVYTVAGGYLTARLAPHRPMRHALALGAVGLLVGTVGLLATWGRGLGPAWYPISIVAMALPCVWAGARLRQRQLSARQPRP